MVFKVLVFVEETLQDVIRIPFVIELDGVNGGLGAAARTRKLVVVKSDVLQQAALVQHDTARRTLLPRWSRTVWETPQLDEANRTRVRGILTPRPYVRAQEASLSDADAILWRLKGHEVAMLWF